MKPLNYAILKYFTKVDEACVNDVIKDLKREYGRFKALNKKGVLSALMTAAANGLLAEKRFELDKSGELEIYYYAPESGAAAINRYIKD